MIIKMEAGRKVKNPGSRKKRRYEFYPASPEAGVIL
jgi:hypothetical protein